MQQIENIDIGAGSGSSAINGARIVANRATQLQIPHAVDVNYVGKSYGVARYDKFSVQEMPNLVNKTNTAISEPLALKKIMRKTPPTAATMNATIKLILGPATSMKYPDVI